MLERARECVRAGARADAHQSFREADAIHNLDPSDLKAMGRAAYMLGRDEEYMGALERAYEAHRRDDAIAAAARCTWWLGHGMLFGGDGLRAEGWFAIGRRRLDDAGLDCVERGYLLAPTWLRQMAAGDWVGGLETAREAEAIGLRFADQDLVWLARDDQARALVSMGEGDDGLRLVNELLVVVSAGQLSPVVSGIVYCNTIVFCRDAFALQHTREWTTGLAQWCERQPQMVAHNGLCLVHRAEILQIQGDWPLALDVARRATERFSAGALNRIALGPAHYRRGEILRLWGKQNEAEAAYREASRAGHEPQPGLALLRLALGEGLGRRRGDPTRGDRAARPAREGGAAAGIR